MLLIPSGTTSELFYKTASFDASLVLGKSFIYKPPKENDFGKCQDRRLQPAGIGSAKARMPKTLDEPLPALQFFIQPFCTMEQPNETMSVVFGYRRTLVGRRLSPYRHGGRT